MSILREEQTTLFSLMANEPRVGRPGGRIPLEWHSREPGRLLNRRLPRKHQQRDRLRPAAPGLQHGRCPNPKAFASRQPSAQSKTHEQKSSQSSEPRLLNRRPPQNPPPPRPTGRRSRKHPEPAPQQPTATTLPPATA